MKNKKNVGAERSFKAPKNDPAYRALIKHAYCSVGWVIFGALKITQGCPFKK